MSCTLATVPYKNHRNLTTQKNTQYTVKFHWRNCQTFLPTIKCYMCETQHFLHHILWIMGWRFIQLVWGDSANAGCDELASQPQCASSRQVSTVGDPVVAKYRHIYIILIHTIRHGNCPKQNPKFEKLDYRRRTPCVSDSNHTGCFRNQ